MRINSSQADKLLRGNPLGFHLRTFASSLVEDGYTDRTIQLKLGLLACLGRWLQPTKLAIIDLDERFLEAFLQHRRRVHGGDLKRSGSFSIIFKSSAWFQSQSRFVTDHPWLTF